ncbi:MAG: arsenate reductase/protein-tyrosine-phosphatase family protein [Promethearchaeota archaeon]|jgi:protein-tyrosine phosphatase
MKKIKNVLFICLGNTARSPAAEYLARYYAKKINVGLIFSSAGFINAFSYMQRQSQEYLNLKKINHSDFQPQLIRRSLLEQQDLILTMERSHSVDIITNYNSIEDIEKKVFTLKEFNGEIEDLDIIDPYYTSSETYKQVLKTIDQNVEKAIKKIITSNDSFCV